MTSGFHVHCFDDTLGEIYIECAMGTYDVLEVGNIRSLLRWPIALGSKGKDMEGCDPRPAWPG